MSSEKADKVIQAVDTSDTVEEEESGFRYAAYANRFRTILRASHRYVAYTSDIGESFRPVAHPYLVKLGYGVSWLYILGDVSYYSWIVKLKSEGRYTEHLKPWDYPYPEPDADAAKAFHATHEKLSESDWRIGAVKRGIFQSIASMGLPAFTIHSAVRYSSVLFKNTKIKSLKTYGPVGIGLGIVPVLPYIFDEPVEAAVDWIFDKGEDLYNGKQKLA
ncbi:mitochondrial 18kDa protein [Scheffersomyces xylosifermentans]|uniref:mitochondrial 18kDa protein n=1 Tax=Scheffersomyces xylosifermentans TaxID=1304137 RepID=UPI00315D8469